MSVNMFSINGKLLKIYLAHSSHAHIIDNDAPVLKDKSKLTFVCLLKCLFQAN